MIGQQSPCSRDQLGLRVIWLAWHMTSRVQISLWPFVQLLHPLLLEIGGGRYCQRILVMTNWHHLPRIYLFKKKKKKKKKNG